MKKISVVIISLWLLVGVLVTQSVAEWMFVGSSQQIANTASNLDNTIPSFGDIALGSMGHINIGAQSFVPMQVDQVIVSLKGIPNVDTELTSNTFSQFMISTGIQTETSDSSIYTNSTDLFPKGDVVKTDSAVLFVGIGLDFGSAFIKGNAFIGQPVRGLNGGYGKSEAWAPDMKGFDAETYGFEASAGYQISEKFALEAGLSRLKNKNDSDSMADEVWAVYAQAILNLAPGMQLIPEVGQIELQNDKQDAEKADFYAGAKWEINF